MPELNENTVVEEVTEVVEETPAVTYKYAISISFVHAFQSYYFGSNSNDYKIGDKVVVETARGLELGTVKEEVKETDSLSLSLALKPIIRKANEDDIKKAESNAILAKKAEEEFNESVKNLKLDMHLIFGEYTLDNSKMIFTYIADDRVDFRELLKILASKLHCRIELKQIGTRDRAKMIGGIGPCGLPICCSTFLSDFEGVSINMAKNQLLALNISKLSGQCGKLICCLQYEDSIYSDLRVGLPKMNAKVTYKDIEYRITSMNVITKVMRLDNKEASVNITFDEFFKECTLHENKPNVQ